MPRTSLPCCFPTPSRCTRMRAAGSYPPFVLERKRLCPYAPSKSSHTIMDLEPIHFGFAAYTTDTTCAGLHG